MLHQSFKVCAYINILQEYQIQSDIIKSDISTCVFTFDIKFDCCILVEWIFNIYTFNLCVKIVWKIFVGRISFIVEINHLQQVFWSWREWRNKCAIKFDFIVCWFISVWHCHLKQITKINIITSINIFSYSNFIKFWRFFKSRSSTNTFRTIIFNFAYTFTFDFESYCVNAYILSKFFTFFNCCIFNINFKISIHFFAICCVEINLSIWRNWNVIVCCYWIALHINFNKIKFIKSIPNIDCFAFLINNFKFEKFIKFRICKCDSVVSFNFLPFNFSSTALTDVYINNTCWTYSSIFKIAVYCHRNLLVNIETFKQIISFQSKFLCFFSIIKLQCESNKNTVFIVHKCTINNDFPNKSVISFGSVIILIFNKIFQINILCCIYIFIFIDANNIQITIFKCSQNFFCITCRVIWRNI